MLQKGRAPLLGLGAAIAGHLGGGLDLAHGRGRLLGRGGLHLGAPADLIDGRQDLACRARQFLHCRRQLLGARPDFLRGLGAVLLGQGVGQNGQAFGRLLALFQRLRLLLHCALGLSGGGGLLLRSGGDVFGALLSFFQRDVALDRREQDRLAAVREDAQVQPDARQLVRHGHRRLGASLG